MTQPLGSSVFTKKPETLNKTCCMWMVRAAFFKITQNWKHPKCTSNMKAVEYYSAMKRDTLKQKELDSEYLLYDFIYIKHKKRQT